MRALPSIPNEDGSCNTARQNYSSLEKYTTFKESTIFNTDELATYINQGQLEADIKDNSLPEAQQGITENLTKLANKEENMNYYTRCISKDINQKQDISSEIYTIQKTLEQKREELKDKEEIAAQAKERASLLEKPYNKTTVWEAWFPLGRPLKKESVPVLLGLSIFFLVLSLGLFLRLASIELQFSTQGYSLDRIPLIGSFFTPRYQ
jgi:hypothetical protein